MYTITAARRAILSTINWCEGSPGYNELYNYVLFNNNGPHPNKTVCAGAYCSTAAGAYQFLHSTWLSCIEALGLPDYMSPENQDQCALYLIDQEGALQDVDSGNVTAAVYNLANIWASLPTESTGTSYYGQGGKSIGEILSYYGTEATYAQLPFTALNGLTTAIILLIIAATIFYINRKNK